jgi:hypothetical protein
MSEGKHHEIVTGEGSRYKFEEIYPTNWRNSLEAFREDAELRNKVWDIKQDNVVIDVGAEYGFYTLHAISRGARMVYAFEPNIDISKHLKNNIVINKFYEHFCKNGHYVGGYDNDMYLQLDKFVDSLSIVPDRIDWLKIDVGEQEEIHVLQGAQKLLRRYHPKILIKTSKPETVQSYLVSFVHPKSELHNLHAKDHWLVLFI